jgi:hypothetical protein
MLMKNANLEVFKIKSLKTIRLKFLGYVEIIEDV